MKGMVPSLDGGVLLAAEDEAADGEAAEAEAEGAGRRSREVHSNAGGGVSCTHDFLLAAAAQGSFLHVRE